MHHPLSTPISGCTHFVIYEVRPDASGIDCGIVVGTEFNDFFVVEPMVPIPRRVVQGEELESLLAQVAETRGEPLGDLSIDEISEWLGNAGIFDPS